MLEKSSGRKKMNLLRRVSIRILRERRKTIILAAAFFVISMLLLSGGAFVSGAREALKELREQFYVCMTVEQTIEGNSSNRIISPEMVEEVVAATKPDGFTGTNVCYLSMENIALIPGRFTMEKKEEATIARLISCRDSRLEREFTKEGFEIIEGRHLTGDDMGKAIISGKLAEWNGLGVGDTLRGVVTDNSLLAAKQGIGTEYEYEIVGLFAISEDSREPSSNRAECETHVNWIFIDEASGFEILENIRCNPRQYVNGLTLWSADPAKLPQMEAQLEALPGYDWEQYYVHTNSAEYDLAAKPMLRMERILFAFLLVVSVISALILGILLTMWNQERTREVAILLSIGCSKGNILLQLFIENLVLFITGFVVAIPVVIIMTVLLKRFIGYGQTGGLLWEYMAIGALECVLVLFVTLGSSISILRKKPKELLTVQ